MTKVRNKELNATMPEYDKEAAIETVRQLLEQTEKLAEDADLAETAFLIGVALASLTQESRVGRFYGSTFGTSSQIM